MQQVAAEKGAVYGEDYVLLGYRPGEEYVILGMGAEIASVYDSDFSATPITEIPDDAKYHELRPNFAAIKPRPPVHP